METDKLLKKVETFLEGYEDKSDVRIKAADYLKGIDMLYKVTVEANREKLKNDTHIIVDFNIFGVSNTAQSPETNEEVENESND